MSAYVSNESYGLVYIRVSRVGKQLMTLYLFLLSIGLVPVC